MQISDAQRIRMLEDELLMLRECLKTRENERLKWASENIKLGALLQQSFGKIARANATISELNATIAELSTPEN